VQVINTVEALQQILQSSTNASKKIGFVPTMGALHEGHVSLLERAISENDLVVASIFVNPTQFNNATDLEKYPRMPLEDIERLRKCGCDIAFLPTTEAIYPDDFIAPDIELGLLDTVMEGKHRPGHFKGVVTVVYRLFDIVKPTNAYFGRKDFQQVAIIKAMKNWLNLPIQIVECPTLRDHKGLALSSRNLLLSKEDLATAYHIYDTLSYGKSLVSTYSPLETKKLMIEFFTTSNMELEYIEIVHPSTLANLTSEWTDGATACLVAYCGNIRLIDNVELIPHK